MPDTKLIDLTISLVLRDAKDRRDNAGMEGSWSDGGASDLEAGVKMWKLGREGKIPDAWKPYQVTAEKLIRMKKIQEDPGYAEYERIQKLIKNE